MGEDSAAACWIDRWRFVLFGLLAAATLAGLNGQWRIDPDSALYLTLARNMARGQGYTYHGVLHRLVYPGFPALASLAFRWHGGSPILICNLLTLLCGTAALMATYRLFSLSTNRPTAVAITLLTGISHEFFRYWHEPMVEMPFLLGTMMVFAGVETLFHCDKKPRWWDWAILAVGVGIAVSVKPMMLILMPIVALDAAWMGWRRGRLGRAAAAVAIMFALSLLFFLVLDPRHPFSTTPDDPSYEAIAQRELDGLPSRGEQVAHNLEELLTLSAPYAVFGLPLRTPLLAPVVGGLMLCGGISLLRFRPAWALWAVAVAVKLTIFFSLNRYLLPIAPFLLFGWVRLLNQLRGPNPIAWLGAGLMGATIAVHMAAACVLIGEQRQEPFMIRYRHGAYASLVRMADELTHQTGKEDLILAPAADSRILTFLADRTVIESGNIAGPAARSRQIFVITPDLGIPDDQMKWMAHGGVRASGGCMARASASPGLGSALDLYNASIVK